MPLLDLSVPQGCTEVGKLFALVLRYGGQDLVGTAIPEHVKLPLAGPLLHGELNRKLPLLAPHPFPISFDSFDDADSSVRHIQLERHSLGRSGSATGNRTRGLKI